MLNTETHHCYALQEAWDAYGNESFSFAVLELCDNIVTAEQTWLDKHSHHCYNTSLQANNPMANPEVAKRVLDTTRKNGSRHTQKLTEQHVLDIVELLSIGKAIKDIAETYMVGVDTIYQIRSGLKWSYLTGIEYNSNNSRKHRLTPADVTAIKLRLRDTDDTAEMIAQDYSVQHSMIAAIRIGRRWAHVQVEGFTEGKQLKSTDCIEDILALKSQGLTNIEIAKQLGFKSASSISYALSKVAPAK
jgi:DNA-binding NarL/FixJ family response regulator